MTADGLLLADRYRLGAVLGRGAMADVHRAHDEVLGRTVAVKLFRHGEQTDHSASRIDTEMRTLASLSHPGLVTLFDAGTARDASGMVVPFLVMELVDGPTLGVFRAHQALTAHATARIGAELSETLRYIHAAGVVHRDIKPANILIPGHPNTGAGPRTSKLADFGIARVVDAARLTEHGTTVGTAHYLSPEQATGSALGPASDIYSLGLVMIECLTGRMVYEGSAVAAAVARLHRDPVVPAELGSDWAALLTAMTAREPQNRPPADELSARFAALERQGPTAVFPRPVTQVTSATQPPPTTQFPSATQFPSTTQFPSATQPSSTTQPSFTTQPSNQPTEKRRARRSTRVWAAVAVAAVASVLVATVVWGSSDDVDSRITDPTPAQPQLPTPEPSEALAPTLVPAPVPVPAVETVTEPVVTLPSAEPAVPIPGPSGNGNGNANGNNGNGAATATGQLRKRGGNGNGGGVGQRRRQWQRGNSGNGNGR
ncbi:serine/threonine-protein kinase [Rhodococcus sp. P1Y]|uniref:serine/threonine-protein kinase n=1 Tax=Rhodococcus sp. P1Y TaxID=1302308 RepID=UPI000EADEC2B|nr:serine/threonine-protein kinase [Rhodococcus sp. P1Y]AYJ48044.1 serine/threonine protein kinase [Rhodococcus sp. P1Y]